MAYIKQIHVAGGLSHFKADIMRRWGAVEVSNPDMPAVFYGMYNPQEKEMLRNHRALARVVWCGSDAMRINDTLAALVKRPGVKNIAASAFISQSLFRWGIDHTIVPLTGKTPQADPCPRGDKVYWYYGCNPDFYGKKYVDEVKKQLPFEFVEARHNTFPKHILYEKYRECFIALRLTPHDGFPTTVIEMGLLGRPSIHNGIEPHCIHWKGVDDIVKSIQREYDKRHEPNEYIARDWEKYVDVGRSWLEY